MTPKHQALAAFFICIALGVHGKALADGQAPDQRADTASGVTIYRGADAKATSSLTCKNIKNVSVCGFNSSVKKTNSPSSVDQVLAGSAPVGKTQTTVVINKLTPVRASWPYRQLRTQGFTNGKVYPSRRFTKGFFADRVGQ